MPNAGSAGTITNNGTDSTVIHDQVPMLCCATSSDSKTENHHFVACFLITMSSCHIFAVFSFCLLLIVYVESDHIEVRHCGLFNHSNLDVITVSKVLDRLEFSDGLSASAAREAESYDVSPLFSDSRAFGYAQKIEIDSDIYSNSEDALSDIMDDLSHLNGLNRQISESNLTENVYDAATWGNVLFCVDDDDENLCSDTAGGSDVFAEYRPMDMNMVTDTDFTVLLDGSMSSTDRIDVVIAWYMVYSAESEQTTDFPMLSTDFSMSSTSMDSCPPEIGDLFPSADAHDCNIWIQESMEDGISTASGYHTAVYEQHWDKVVEEVGKPGTWSRGGDIHEGDDYVVFVYGKAVYCSNDRVYNAYRQGDNGGSGGYGFGGWEIIGIIFGCIVVLACIVLGITGILSGDCSGSESKKKGQYKYVRPGSNADELNGNDVVEMEANGHTGTS